MVKQRKLITLIAIYDLQSHTLGIFPNFLVNQGQPFFLTEDFLR